MFQTCRKARERLVVVLDKKKAQEKEIFQLTLERNELKSHLDKLQEEMEGVDFDETRRKGTTRGSPSTKRTNEGGQEELIRELKAKLDDKQERLTKYEERVRQLELKLEEVQGNTPKAGAERTPRETANIEVAFLTLDMSLSLYAYT